MFNSEKRLGALISEAIEDIQRIIRAQIELAVAELKASGKRALRASALAIAAGVLLVLSLPLLIIALGFGLVALGVPAWLAFLILAGVFILSAGLLLMIAASNAKKIKAPTRAADAFEKTNNEISKAIARLK